MHLPFGGRDVSGLPIAAILFLLSRNCGLAFTLIIAQVALRLSENAVAVLEFGDGHRGSETFVVVIFRILKRARALFASDWHTLYIDCVGNPSTISRDCGLSVC